MPTDVAMGRAQDGEAGSYIFEMSRLLQTASTATDAQLEAGKAIDFGFAYWDPYEIEETGWTDSGHFVTGCSRDWISLKLVDENGEVAMEEEPTADDTQEPAADEGTSSATKSSAVLAVATAFASMLM